ncbi:uncharacterized protein LOC133038108 [Cannabis sativa]|uniref:uncharacterized protein LOC133038108 n=1 Tax=Cannabis sativa TaxID=3483 RepID=UPI0029CA87F0|nr:uncharacterized protein LOC133038108 [Cannabis sativa]
MADRFGKMGKRELLREGDQNSKFLHAKATSRRRNNFIQKLKNNDGEWVSWEDDLPTVVTNYFQQVFGYEDVEFGDVLHCLQPRITEEQNVLLMESVTAEEIKKALFQMHPHKSPGPDGMTPGFYQKFWHIVGDDIVNLVRSFFNNGTLPRDLNNTNIVLIPKKKVLELMIDLRPISLCNVIYKIISKVLANRLKLVLPDVISSTQRAFLPGRLISDNIMVSFEIMHYLKRKRVGKDGFMALKLDMSKAYDCVGWAFLEAMMIRMVARGAPRVSHMLFADDSYVYCKTNEDEAAILLQLLQVYQRASGQQAGKEVLLKSVAQALPSSVMSVFLLTKEICSNLEGLISKFWWKSHANSSSKGVSWMSWKRLCRHKYDGGIGFRDLHNYNLAFLGKQGWRLLNNKNSLVSRIYKARYYPLGTYLTASLGPNPSFIWRSFFEAEDLVIAGARKAVGDGTSVNILQVLWLPDQHNPFVISNHPALEGQMVGCLFPVGLRRWDADVVNDLFEERDRQLVLSIQLSDRVERDSWYWNKENSGLYTIKSAYLFLQNSAELEPVAHHGYKQMWQLDIPPKVKHFLWHAISGCLPIKPCMLDVSSVDMGAAVCKTLALGS